MIPTLLACFTLYHSAFGDFQPNLRKCPAGCYIASRPDLLAALRSPHRWHPIAPNTTCLARHD